ncbi:MAG: chromate transporter [Clostridia bacterium]|nr:chromate transporter [Clostridia bacterium]
MKKHSILFLTMLKIGLFTFGGGYAMIALLENEFVSKKKWIEKEEFLNMVAIAESTPGPIAINAATYIGYKNAGVMGSALCTLGVCIPSFLIIYAISLFLDAFLTLTIVANAFKGIQVCVIYLILSAGIKMLKAIKKNLFNTAIIISTVVCMVLLSLFAIRFSTVFYILISGIAGVAVYLIGKLRKDGEK